MILAITKLHFTYDVTEAVDYYNEVTTEKFQSLKWFTKDDQTSDPTILGVYGWAIQYPKDYSDKVYAKYNKYDLGIDLYKESAIAFGFARKILDAFPLAFRAAIYVNPPSTHFLPHVDTMGVFKIHIPILSNKGAVWITEDGETNMKPGTAYLIDTTKTHETINRGTTDRVHIEIEMRREDLHTINNYLSD